MSYYYSYYIGIEIQGKIYPFGPYNANEKLCAVISRSRSFASDLHDHFVEIPEEMFSDKLIDANFTPTEFPHVKYLRVDDLPTGSYIKRGYFLIEDVKEYEKDNSSCDLFYDCLSPDVYSAMLQNESMFGKPEKVSDCEGNDITPHSASDYMYYAYPDYSCAEYEATVLRETAELLNCFDYGTISGNLVVILSEG